MEGIAYRIRVCVEERRGGGVRAWLSCNIDRPCLTQDGQRGKKPRGEGKGRERERISLDSIYHVSTQATPSSPPNPSLLTFPAKSVWFTRRSWPQPLVSPDWRSGAWHSNTHKCTHAHARRCKEWETWRPAATSSNTIRITLRTSETRRKLAELNKHAWIYWRAEPHQDKVLLNHTTYATSNVYMHFFFKKERFFSKHHVLLFKKKKKRPRMRSSFT